MKIETTNRVKILIAEDDLASRKLLVSLFFRQGNIDIIEAKDGEEALSKVIQHNLDLILLDIHMPKRDGISILKTIRRNKKFLLTPIIMVTVDEKEKLEALRQGASDFIIKPYDKRELRLKVINQVKIKKYSKDVTNTLIYKTKELHNQLLHIQETQKKFLIKIAMHTERQMIFSDANRAEKIATYTKHLARLCCNMSQEQLKNLFYSAAFHNIGFISLPDSIKNKKGTYSDKDRALMQKHIKYGSDFLEGLENTDLINITKPIIEEYCERWDGKGYPKGLKGDNISFYARIVSIVVYFNALTSNRKHRINQKNFTDKEIYMILKSQSGKIFDPILLEVFLDNFRLFLKLRDRFVRRRKKKIIKS